MPPMEIFLDRRGVLLWIAVFRIEAGNQRELQTLKVTFRLIRVTYIDTAEAFRKKVSTIWPEQSQARIWAN
jgi:hypothetical protein